MLSSLCAARVSIVQKRKIEKFRDIYRTPNAIGTTPAKCRRINLQKFPSHGFCVF